MLSVNQETLVGAPVVEGRGAGSVAEGEERGWSEEVWLSHRAADGTPYYWCVRDGVPGTAVWDLPEGATAVGVPHNANIANPKRTYLL